jgi:hypothetical protein
MHRPHRLLAFTTLVVVGAFLLFVNSDFYDLADVDRITARAESVEEHVQQSGAPQRELVGQIGGPSLALEMAGDLLLAGVGPRVYAWDTTTEDGPTLLGASDVLPGIVRDIEVVGDTAYVAAGHLVTIDLTHPESLPLGKKRFAPLDGQKAVAVGVNGSWVYVATVGREVSGDDYLVTLSNTPEAGLQVVRRGHSGGGVKRQLETYIKLPHG